MALHFLHQRKLLLHAALSAAALFVTWAAYSSFRTTRGLFLEKLEAKVLQQVQHSGYQLDHWLLARKTEILTLANTPTLRSMDWEQVAPFLKPELERLSDFYFFSMVNPDGRYYSTKVGRVKGKNLSDRKHVQAALSGHVYVSDRCLSK